MGNALPSILIFSPFLHELGPQVKTTDPAPTAKFSQVGKKPGGHDHYALVGLGRQYPAIYIQGLAGLAVGGDPVGIVCQQAVGPMLFIPPGTGIGAWYADRQVGSAKIGLKISNTAATPS